MTQQARGRSGYLAFITNFHYASRSLYSASHFVLCFRRLTHTLGPLGQFPAPIWAAHYAAGQATYQFGNVPGTALIQSLLRVLVIFPWNERPPGIAVSPSYRSTVRSQQVSVHPRHCVSHLSPWKRPFLIQLTFSVEWNIISIANKRQVRYNKKQKMVYAGQVINCLAEPMKVRLGLDTGLCGISVVNEETFEHSKSMKDEVFTAFQAYDRVMAMCGYRTDYGKYLLDFGAYGIIALAIMEAIGLNLVASPYGRYASRKWGECGTFPWLFFMARRNRNNGIKCTFMSWRVSLHWNSSKTSSWPWTSNQKRIPLQFLT